MGRIARLQGLLVDNGRQVPRQAARIAYLRFDRTSEHEPLPPVAQQTPAQPRERHLHPGRALLAGAAWVGTIFSVFLHLIDDSGQQRTGLPGVLDILGTVSGLIAMNLLLFMLLLTARVPVIDRVLGQVRATRWRRLLAQVTALGAASRDVRAD